MTSYKLPPARYRVDPPAPVRDLTRTDVVVVRGQHKGRRGWIKGTFERPVGVKYVFVFFAPEFPGDCTECHKIDMSFIVEPLI